MWPLLVRWAAVGAAMYVGSKIAEHVWASANEDGWISDGVKETLEGLKYTHTGRKPDVSAVPESKGYVPMKDVPKDKV